MGNVLEGDMSWNHYIGVLQEPPSMNQYAAASMAPSSDLPNIRIKT